MMQLTILYVTCRSFVIFQQPVHKCLPHEDAAIKACEWVDDHIGILRRAAGEVVAEIDRDTSLASTASKEVVESIAVDVVRTDGYAVASCGVAGEEVCEENLLTAILNEVATRQDQHAWSAARSTARDQVRVAIRVQIPGRDVQPVSERLLEEEEIVNEAIGEAIAGE